MYKLITVLAAQAGINVEDSDGVDVRVILVAWSDQEEEKEEAATTPYGPIIDLPTLAKCGRPWQFAFGVETDNGEKMVREFVAAKQSTEDTTSAGSRANSSSLAAFEGGGNEGKHHSIAVGGTWDHIHSGHKLLLTMTLFLIDPPRGDSSRPQTATIGITGDALLVNKKHAQLLQSWMERQKSCAVFTNSIVDFSTATSSQGSRQVSIRDDKVPNGKGVDVSYPNGLAVKFTEIQDPFGPTITEEEIEGLVVSGETRSGGQAVNDKRKELGWRELRVFEVEVLDAEEAEGEGVREGFEGKLSSSGIREKLARKVGGKM